MPHSRGGLSLGVPTSSPAWGSSDQSPQRQRVHIGGLVEGRSGGLLSGRTLTQSDTATWLTLSSVGGTVGGVLRMLNQSRHYWTPPKWLSSSVVFPLDGNLPTVWLHFLWTSGGRARCRMSPGCGRRWGMPGRAAREQCLWGRHRWWDSKKQTKKNKKLYLTFSQNFLGCWLETHLKLEVKN